MIISKIDIIKESSITSEVDYKVYTKEGVLLDLSNCDSVNSDISYPIINYDLTNAYEFNSLNVDIFNKNDPFFNDICFKYDLSLEERREQIYTENVFCERNCIYSNINFTNSKVNCNCSDYIANKEFSSLPFSTFYIIKCYRTYSEWSNLNNNIAFWYLGFCELISIVVIIIVKFKEITHLMMKISKTILFNPPKVDDNFFTTRNDEITTQDKLSTNEKEKVKYILD